jgi:hypothetical protein
MDMNARYVLACIRFAAVADPRAWTEQDLLDVAALCDAPIPPDEWQRRLGGAANVPAKPAVEDPETSATIEALLGSAGGKLKEQGIISIEEVKNGS